LTVSIVMIGPPDLSTTMSPDLKTAIAKILGESNGSDAVALHNSRSSQLLHPRWQR
jgi:hypothetical protein